MKKILFSDIGGTLKGGPKWLTGLRLGQALRSGNIKELVLVSGGGKSYASYHASQIYQKYSFNKISYYAMEKSSCTVATDADVLLYICEHANIKPKDCLFIGDGSPDKLQAKAMSVPFINVKAEGAEEKFCTWAGIEL